MGSLLEAHQEHHCPAVEVVCPHCAETIRRGDRDRHLGDDCPQVTLQCPVKGCPVTCTRRDLADHLTDPAQVVKHAAMVAGSLAAVEAALVAKDERIDDLERRLKTANRETEIAVTMLGRIMQEVSVIRGKTSPQFGHH
eukprot:NODE_2128_length_832_cov_107.664112_g1493_i0.p1 GENE.NODE_2128_length_832_cov_107.664112_g1493_i0~~NODE_2128_length_832_cov_107.664112_g1493_i0.p1  ORF type:complete len:150 (-),score=44.40 NODE_2128_length_832_cov_107.664112_g1493_i0:383-799(-)